MSALEDSPELKKVYNEVDYIHELIDTAAQMEGTVRSAGTHAAGVIISDKPIVEYAPLHRPTSGSEESPIKSVMQYEMSHVDKLGLLKVDFLGLVTLTVMQRACKLIKERHGIEFDLNNIPTDDPETYEFIGKGHTAGMFQLEGSGMTRWIVQMKPQTLANVIAMVALFRPGPMDFIPSYIRRMHGEEQVEYKHPALEKIMKETYGIAVYQEQVMFAAIEMAGYSPSEADNLRKAISKKNRDAIEKHRNMFVTGCVKNEIAEETAQAIFEEWENFARYGFNKSHAADYGVIAVQTAYLKTHYTVEYMTALLSASKNDTDKVAFYASDCRSMGIDVLPPDINLSGWDFTIEDRQDNTSAIRFGLGAVKNVGINPVETIMAGRSDGSYKDLTDMAHRLDLRSVGKRPLESLIKVGALDSFGQRLALLQSLDRIVNVSSAHFRAQECGQLSFFGGDSGVSETIHLPFVKEPERKELLSWEKELIGLYISSHPLTPYLPLLDQKTSHLIGQLTDVASGEKVAIGGIVVKFRPHFTKDGKPMGFATIEDVQGEIELVLFPRVWAKHLKLIHEEAVLIVEGKVDSASASPKLLVDRINEISMDDVRKLPEKSQSESKVSKEQPARQTATVLKSEFTIPVDWDGVGLEGLEAEDAFLEDDWEPEVELIEEEEPAVTPVVEIIEKIIVPPPMLDPQANKNGASMITIILRSSHDRDRDIRRMKTIQGLMQSCPGRDHYTFHIIEDEKWCLIEFPNHTTGIHPELIARLEGLVGKENYKVEPI